MFTSPYYERLEAALARHEAAGHVATVALAQLAPRLAPGDEQTDPAAQLATMLDQATSQLPPGRNRRPRVGGLIAMPAAPIAGEMQTALADRQALIETAARRLVQEAQDAGAACISRLGTPSPEPKVRAQWLAETATVALYRYRYEITGPSPLRDAKSIHTPEQAAECRAAQVALTRLRRLTKPAIPAQQTRGTARVDQGRSFTQ